MEEFKAAWRSSVGLKRFQELLLGLLLNIFDARSRTYMIVVVVVQEANIDSEAFLEDLGHQHGNHLQSPRCQTDLL